jgi:hypothetical protein
LLQHIERLWIESNNWQLFASKDASPEMKMEFKDAIWQIDFFLPNSKFLLSAVSPSAFSLQTYIPVLTPWWQYGE